MKKAVICVLLVLLAGLLVLPASAAAEEHPHNSDHCVCGGSAVGIHDHTCEDITWTAMPTGIKDFGASALTDGNYYLTQDLTVTGITALKNKKLSICLNGYDINTEASAVFGLIRAGSVVNICDCSGAKDADGSWTWGGTVYAKQTSGARDYGGVFNQWANSTTNIYGGNFVGASNKNGGVFNICNDGHGGAAGDQYKDLYDTNFNFYNGHVTGGSATATGGAINSWHYVNVNLYGGTIVGGTAPTKGNLAIAADTRLTVENCTITGGNPGIVLVMDNAGYEKPYTTLSAALAKVTETQYIRLTGDINEAVTVPDGVLIDLAGNNLSGVTVSAGACFMDSTTDGYYGGIAGSLTPASGAIADTYKTTAAQAGAVKRYLVLKENGSYSFHRYYMAITKLTLKPGTAGMGYKATFVGSDEVGEALSSTVAYGYKMWLNEDNKIVRGYPASRFGGEQELTLRIDNFLDSSLTDEANEQRAHIPVYACAYIKLADGTLVETDTVSYTFRDMLEKANSSYSSYSTTQQEALKSLSRKFSNSMICWDISSIHHPFGSVWQSVDNEAFNTLLENNSNKLPSGSYVLTEDVDIGSKTIRIATDTTVNICLNGHTLSDSVRMFNNYGKLSFCDCHADGEEGSVIGRLDTTEDVNKYSSVVYSYYKSVTNLYGGNLISTGNITKGGVVAVSHDGGTANAALPAGVFNMYGGTISGGNTYKEGGNVILWNKSTFNMYGGTISGGTAGTNGSCVYISSDCTLNIYGGTITGGTAGTYGGNIFNKGTLTIYDGTISGGTAVGGRGGNIYTPNGKLSMYGGTVTGGSAPTLTDESGAAVYHTGVGSGIYINEGGTYISGDVVIDGNENGNLFMSGLAEVNIEKLGENAKIGISGDTHGFISNDTAVLQHIASDQEGYGFCTVNGKVLMEETGYTPSIDPNISTFSVGYAMTSIQPTESGLTMSNWGNPNGRKTDGSVGYELFATTIAITDQANNTVLMITLDLQGPSDTFHKNFRSKISSATGIPAEQIYISATHTHNCPSLTTSSNGNARYLYMLTDRLVQSALDALADRAPATMQTGSFDTSGMNWTRHYYYLDENGEKVYFGDQFGKAPASGTPVYHVRDGDTTMHMMAFQRTGKQPVLVTNWRAHPHRSGGRESYSVDADVIGATRAYIHEKTNYLFAYFQGAAGNVNTFSKISGETYKSGKIKEYGEEMCRQIMENGLPQLKDADTGLIQTKQIIYAANVDHSQDSKYEDALALKEYYYANPVEMNNYDNQIAKAAEYGFTSVFHATRLIVKHDLPKTKDLELNIFSIGDSIGFYTAPAELWDSFSEETEQLSPYETTFCIGYCNGGVAYIPYKLDYYVSYEYFYCLFTQDETIDQMQDYYLEHLQQQYDNAAK